MEGDMTISAALERIEEQMTIANLAESTRKAYRLEIRRFYESVGKESSEVAVADLRGQVLGRTESGLTPGWSTCRRRLCGSYSATRWTVRTSSRGSATRESRGSCRDT